MIAKNSNKYKYAYSPVETPFYMESSATKICILDTFTYTSELPEYSNLDDHQLTKMSMDIAQISLKEDWENEDDARWLSFLKD